jgi:SAM-dependent methyltransferase
MLKKLASEILYNPELRPPSNPRRIMVRGNQTLFERGITPPWVWSADQCRDYWAGRDHTTGANAPSEYANKNRAIVGLLNDFWQPEVTPASTVLEVGCNAGANLWGLRELGFERLSAVEINPNAIAEMRRAFPELNANVELGPAEETLPRLMAGSADVVFSMAVLIHVHPSSNRVFAEMVRVAGRYLCVVEAEHTTVPYIFARNYRRVFERLGCVQLRSTRITEPAFPQVGREYWGYTARLFAAPRERVAAHTRS